MVVTSHRQPDVFEAPVWCGTGSRITSCSRMTTSSRFGSIQRKATKVTESIRKPKSTAASNKKSKGFTDEERAAMKDRAQELKAEARANKNKADGESEVLAKIAAMPEPDRSMAKRLHALIKASAPDLSPKTW